MYLGSDGGSGHDGELAVGLLRHSDCHPGEQLLQFGLVGRLRTDRIYEDLKRKKVEMKYSQRQERAHNVELKEHLHNDT